VPYCRTRCGYCDFNTYTLGELTDADGTVLAGAATSAFVDAALAELDLAQAVVGRRLVPTVFVGGGTPTLLPSSELVRLLDGVRRHFDLAPDAEVTTEANPESVTTASLAELREGGFTRISYGMQSATPHVLATLDRVHTPGRAIAAVGEARAAGFDDVSLDLIYGTPGETDAEWASTLAAAVEARPDHVSAYALIVEEGTALARRIRHGDIAAPDDDELADRYLIADQVLAAAGLEWYELSNWARPGHECRHNLAYWRSADWWGIGPGAHSHVDGVRWWNVRHPVTYASRLAARVSPGEAREVLAPVDRRVERVLLELRLAEGMTLAVLTATERARLPVLSERSLVDVRGDRVRLTMNGRLLADAVVRDLLD
jgi:oxygen-independent coproporphyrinogen-3 oxidase